MALICEVSIQDKTHVLYNVHIESRGNNDLRISQLSEVLTEVKSVHPPTPVIIAGDFNFDISEAPAAALIVESRLKNPLSAIGRHATVPERHRRSGAAIDWILTNEALSPRQSEIHSNISASDHFPISLQL